MITSAQIRAARALIGWKQTDLASASGLSLTGLNNIERDAADPKSSTLSAIQRALEKAGVVFTNGDKPGVQLGLYLSVPVAVEGSYIFECKHQDRVFKVIIDKKLLDDFDQSRDPKQPSQHRLRRLPWFVLPRLYVALEAGREPIDGKIILFAEDFGL